MRFRFLAVSFFEKTLKNQDIKFKKMFTFLIARANDLSRWSVRTGANRSFFFLPTLTKDTISDHSSMRYHGGIFQPDFIVM